MHVAKSYYLSTFSLYYSSIIHFSIWVLNTILKKMKFCTNFQTYIILSFLEITILNHKKKFLGLILQRTSNDFEKYPFFLQIGNVCNFALVGCVNSNAILPKWQLPDLQTSQREASPARTWNAAPVFRVMWSVCMTLFKKCCQIERFVINSSLIWHFRQTFGDFQLH